MRESKELGWIKEHDEKKPARRRPYKIYSLKVGFEKIISQIEN